MAREERIPFVRHAGTLKYLFGPISELERSDAGAELETIENRSGKIVRTKR